MKVRDSLLGMIIGWIFVFSLPIESAAQSEKPSQNSVVSALDNEVSPEEWIERVNKLIDLCERHKDRAIVPESIYQSNNLELMAAYLHQIQSDNTFGDPNRLLAQMKTVAIASEQPRFLKLISFYEAILWDTYYLNGELSTEDLRSLAMDPDWMIALPAMQAYFAFQGAELYRVPESFKDHALLIEPPLNDPLYSLYSLYYADYTGSQFAYGLDAKNAYMQALKKAYYLEKIGVYPLITVELNNLSHSLRLIMPPEELARVFERLIDIEFSAPSLNAQNAMLHYNTFYRMRRRDGGRILERANAHPIRGDLGQIILTKFNLQQALLDDDEAKIKETYSPYAEAYAKHVDQSPLETWAKLKLGELNFGEAYLLIQNHETRKNQARRHLFRSTISRSEADEYFIDQGIVKKREPISDFNSRDVASIPLPKLQRDILLNAVSRVRAVQTGYSNIEVPLESHFIDYLLGHPDRSSEDFYIDQEYDPWSDPNLKKHIGRNKESWRRIRNAPIYSGVLRQGINLESTIDFLPSNSGGSHNYGNLTKIIDDIYARQLNAAWTNLLATRANAKNVDNGHFIFDLGSVETLLYFLEGNSLNLIDHIDRHSKQALEINRKIDLNTTLIMLAVTLESEGYYADALSVLDQMGVDSEGAPHLFEMRNWVKSKAHMGLGQIDKANDILDLALEVTLSDELRPHILLDRLKGANETGRIVDIKSFRSELLSNPKSQNSATFLETIRPEILRARYLIAKHNGDADEDVAKQAYLEAQQQLDQSEFAFKDSIARRRQQAQIKATSDALSGLETERLSAEAQSRMTKFLLVLAGLLSVFGGLALFMAYRQKTNVMKLNAKLESRGRLFNRSYKDSLFDTQRFVKKMSNSLEKVNETVNDVSVATRLETILEDLREHETEQTRRALARRNSLSKNSAVNEIVRLDSFFQNVSQYWEAQRPSSDVAIRFNTFDQMPAVSTDAQYMDFALKEAIQASIDHTEYGYILVEASYDEAKEILTITVSDSGNGLQDPDVHYTGGRDAISRLGGTASFDPKPGSKWTTEYQIPAPVVSDFHFPEESHNVVKLESINDR